MSDSGKSLQQEVNGMKGERRNWEQEQHNNPYLPYFYHNSLNSSP